jgi:hypothetical protein
MLDEFVNVRYMVDDVETAVAFYTTRRLHGALQPRPAFADVTRGHLRVLLSGRSSTAPADAPRAHARAQRLEPHPPDRRRPRRGHRAPFPP